MTRLREVVRKLRAPRLGYLVGLGLALLFAAVGIANRHHPRTTETVRALAQLPFPEDTANLRAYSGGVIQPMPASYIQKESYGDQSVLGGKDMPHADEGRKIVRTASIDLIVQHPSEIAQEITEVAEKVGGYLVTADGGGQNATSGTLTIRVPAARFEEMRAQIRKLGVRVESEKFEAKDVTQAYVDQASTIRNLRAEEAQYLAILQQSHTVNDMIFVSQKLSEVRANIEKQEAEFNSMSHQTETVAISISLRTEKEEQVFGVNWYPLYELKLAAADAVAEVINYTVAMATILFYLPAVLLWTGTIFLAVVFGWRTVVWVRRRWSHWTTVQEPVQG